MGHTSETLILFSARKVSVKAWWGARSNKELPHLLYQWKPSGEPGLIPPPCSNEMASPHLLLVEQDQTKSADREDLSKISSLVTLYPKYSDFS